MSDMDLDRLKKLLEEEHHWPTDYIFKFIVPQAERDAFIKATAPLSWSEKPSSKGNYTAFSCTIHANGSEEILQVYRQAGTIKGMIAL